MIFKKITKQNYSIVHRCIRRLIYIWGMLIPQDEKHDKTYLKLLYFFETKEKLDFENVQSFNEKLQWLKIYDRKHTYTTMVDKYSVKQYVAEKIGSKYIIPTLGVWDSFDEIDFDQLPNQFVLKCTHDNGSVIICREKNNLDIPFIKKKLNNALRKNLYYRGREWPYKDVRPRIIAEPYMVDDGENGLIDYKVLCFHGKPQLIQIHQGRFGRHTQDYYDLEWHITEYEQKHTPRSGTVLEKTSFLEEMLLLSEKLSSGIPHVRVDWYFCNSQLYFGELTFFDSSGFDLFSTKEQDLTIGSYLDLNELRG